MGHRPMGFGSPKVRELSPTLRTVNLTESGMLPKNYVEKVAEISLKRKNNVDEKAATNSSLGKT